jgi:hypothetical protein
MPIHLDWTALRNAARLADTARFAAALIVVGLGPPATAQDPRAPAASAECLPRATRAREHCDPKQTTVRTETEVEFSLELPKPETRTCAASIAIEYSQRDTVVNVEGTIENPDCAASDGDYRLTVRVRDENAAVKTLEFVESWQRDDGRPVEFAADYPIGENVDLVGVRARPLRCTCKPSEEGATP